MSDLTSDGEEVRLIRVRDAASVVGRLVPLTIKHLDDFRIVWREQLRTSADEDQYWDWEQKQRIYLAGGMGLYEGYAIWQSQRCANECEQLTQGMMLIQVRGYRTTRRRASFADRANAPTGICSFTSNSTVESDLEP